MDGDTGISIIHKKAQVAREGFDARAMSPAKALRLSLARSADERLGLAVVISTLEQTRISTNELLGQLQGTGMLLLLDGVEGARGVAHLDGQCVSAIVEQQISGQVRLGPASDRGYTRTDAAMMAPLLDATLAGYDTRLAKHSSEHLAGDFRFGDKVEDTRALSLVLEGAQFDLFRMTLDIAEGARTGVMMIALPCREDKRKAATVQENDADAQRLNLSKSAMDASLTLSAVLSRVNVPLNQICNLAPGMVLPLPVGSLDQSELIALSNHVVADIRLGQLNGMRAARVILPPEALSAGFPTTHDAERGAIEQAGIATGAEHPVPPGRIEQPNPTVTPHSEDLPVGDLDGLDLSAPLPALPETIVDQGNWSDESLPEHSSQISAVP